MPPNNCINRSAAAHFSWLLPAFRAAPGYAKRWTAAYQTSCHNHTLELTAFWYCSLPTITFLPKGSVMGTWGPGSFENDGAGDFRDSVTYQLMGKIEECFESEEGDDLD